MRFPDDLTPPERELWDAFPEGRWVDLRTGTAAEDDPAEAGAWGPGRTVRAAVVAALLLGVNPPQPGAVASLRLAGARITGPLELAGAQFSHPVRLEFCCLEEHADLRGAATAALRLTDCRCRGIDLALSRIDGTLNLHRSVLNGGLELNNAHVGGQLHLTGARIVHHRSWAVSAGGLEVAGGFFCRDRFTAEGGFRVAGAQLSGLFMEDARIRNPGGVAFSADNATATVIRLSDGFTADGDVRMPSARVTDLVLDPAAPPTGIVDLRGAQVTSLHDGAHSWSADIRLEGLVYGSLRAAERGGRDPVDRLAWVARGLGYTPQPYEQLAAWYRQIGHEDEARRVLLVKQRARRRMLPPAGRVWSHLLDVTVGYGYRPWLAGVWLCALTLIGSPVFGAGERRAVRPGEGPGFEPFVYTLDLLIPIGGLGQREHWYMAGGTAQLLSYVFIALGWLLTTALVAGVTRTFDRA